MSNPVSVSDHTRARLLSKDKPIHPDWMQHMRRAVELGEQWKVDETKLHTRIFDEIPHPLLQRVIGCGRNSQAARKAAYAAFYAGVMQKMSRTIAKATWGSVAQNELAKALLWLPQDQARELIDGASILGLESNEWFNNCTGAIGTARTVRFLLDSGFFVYWSTINEDVFDKIDLLVHAEDSSRGYCLQIKSRNTDTGSAWEQLNWTKILGSAYEGYLRRFLSGVRGVGKLQPGRWKPILLQVGVLEVPRHQIEPCPHLAQVLRELTSR